MISGNSGNLFKTSDVFFIVSFIELIGSLVSVSQFYNTGFVEKVGSDF